MTSLETHLESESSQDMSQDSIFGLKEETWTSKIRTDDKHPLPALYTAPAIEVVQAKIHNSSGS